MKILVLILSLSFSSLSLAAQIRQGVQYIVAEPETIDMYIQEKPIWVFNHKTVMISVPGHEPIRYCQAFNRDNLEKQIELQAVRIEEAIELGLLILIPLRNNCEHLALGQPALPSE